MRKLVAVLVLVASPLFAQSPIVDSFGSQGAFTTDATASGTLGALNAAVTLIVRGRGGVGVQIITTNLNATVTPEVSFDGGTTWVATSFVTVAGATASTVVFSGGADTQQRSILVTGGVSHVRVRVSSYTSGTTTGATMRATEMSTLQLASIPGSVSVTQGTSPWVVSNGGTFPVQAAQSGTWTVQPGNTANSTAWLVTGTGGTFPVTGPLTDTQLRATPVPVSGTVTANAGTNLNTSALLTTTAHDAAFGTAGTADTQVRTIQGIASMTPVQVQSNGASLATTSSFGSAFPSVGTAAGFTDGTNMQPARTFDADSAGGQQFIQGVMLRTSAPGGSVEIGVTGSALIIEPGGSATQPVSGTVAVSTLTSTTTLTPGTAANNLGKAEDQAANTGDVGVMALGVREDTLATTAANGDYQPFKSDSVGGVYVAPDRYLGAASSAANGFFVREAQAANTDATWTSATSINTTNFITTTGYTTATVEILCTGAITGGQITFAGNTGSYVSGDYVRGFRRSTGAGTPDETYGHTSAVLATGCAEHWQFNIAGYTQFGPFLTTVITGAGSVAVRVTVSGGSSIHVGANVAAVGGTAVDTNSGNKSAGTQRVVLATDQPNLTTPLNANVSQWAGTATQTGSGTATGAARVELPTNGTGTIASITTSIVPGTAATNLGKAEDVGAASGDVGVGILGVRKDTNATMTSADADYVALAADNYGVLSVSNRHPNAIRCTVTVSTATTITAVGGSCAAPGAGLSIYITDVMFSSSAAGIAADAFPTLKYGTGGTCGTGTTVFWGQLAAAATQATDNRTTPIKIPANNEVCWITTTAGSKFLVIGGFIAP